MDGSHRSISLRLLPALTETLQFLEARAQPVAPPSRRPKIGDAVAAGERT